MLHRVPAARLAGTRKQRRLHPVTECYIPKACLGELRLVCCELCQSIKVFVWSPRRQCQAARVTPLVIRVLRGFEPGITDRHTSVGLSASKMQADSLVASCDVPGEVADILLQLWLATVTESGVLHPDTAQCVPLRFMGSLCTSLLSLVLAHTWCHR